MGPSEQNTNNEKQLQEQFSLLFRRYELPLYNFALKTIQSELLAKDIIQDVFIKLWLRREEIAAIDNIEGYLYRMTRNKVIDLLRLLANDKQLREDYFREHTWEELPVYDLITVKEQQNALSGAISRLPPQRRIIYQLSQEKGLSRKEIAAQLNISPSTVKNQLTSAIDFLRKFIAGKINIF